MESEDMEILSGDYSGQKFGWERERDEVVWGGGGVEEGLILFCSGRNLSMFGGKEGGRKRGGEY